MVITGPNKVIICHTCIYKYAHHFGLSTDEPEDQLKGGQFTPKQIKTYLDEHIIGQDRAKKALSVAIYNHYKRVDLSGFTEDDEDESTDRMSEQDSSITSEESNSSESDEVLEDQERSDKMLAEDNSSAAGDDNPSVMVSKPRAPISIDPDVRLTKGNILMVGPTGVGKTAIAERIAELLDVPFVVKDATTLTSAGYVGEDVESIIRSLWEAADRDIDQAQRGIVVIDEIDKVARRGSGGGGSSSRDVGGEGVQQALLKLIESNLVNIQADMGLAVRNELIQIDTTNILFIFCGAFVGLEQLIQRRMSPGSIGFGLRATPSSKDRDYDKLIKHLRTDDLVSYGLIPEFIGRLPVLVPMSNLSAEAMREILWKPKSSLIRQYKRLMQLSKVDLEFTEDALDEVVEQAMKRKSGARGLRSVIERVMLKVMYDVPDLPGANRCIIDAEVVRGDCDAQMIEQEGQDSQTEALSEVSTS
jgi:ATP-dependent Clp protease ATP-binding subunit ClpX